MTSLAVTQLTGWLCLMPSITVGLFCLVYGGVCFIAAFTSDGDDSFTGFIGFVAGLFGAALLAAVVVCLVFVR